MKDDDDDDDDFSCWFSLTKLQWLSGHGTKGSDIFAVIEI